MRILFDQVAHDMRNKGNNALLQAAQDRLAQFWPDASLALITVAPNLARLYFPKMQTVRPEDLQPFRSRLDKYQKFIPSHVLYSLFETREALWHWRSAKRLSRIRSNSQFEEEQARNKQTFIDVSDSIRPDNRNIMTQTAISGYDLYVASGGGYMCDHDKWLLLNLFDRLEAAINRGIPAVLVGQGVGPLTDPDLLARARAILPKVDLILYRNQRLGLPLLDSLGVPPDRAMMTGDDAIELAFNARQDYLGNGIGVSLRVSPYTKVKQSQLETLRFGLNEAGKKYQAEFIAAPISSASHESDISHIRQVLDGYNRVSIGWRKLDTYNSTIKKIGRCRLMVSGTYHGAIFSLAQGIPVIGVARSFEYFNKLAELNDEFGPGCQVISLDDEQFVDKFIAAIDDTWASADALKPFLLDCAVRQIKLQRTAYQRIFKLVESRYAVRPVFGIVNS